MLGGCIWGCGYRWILTLPVRSRTARQTHFRGSALDWASLSCADFRSGSLNTTCKMEVVGASITTALSLCFSVVWASVAKQQGKDLRLISGFCRLRGSWSHVTGNSAPPGVCICTSNERKRVMTLVHGCSDPGLGYIAPPMCTRLYGYITQSSNCCRVLLLLVALTP